MSLIKSISGIRGTIGGKTGENLTPVDVVKFAAAYGTWIKKKSGSTRIVIGRDARPSGEMVNALVTATEEFGDLLFSLVNYARFIQIDPEEALERTNKKFIKRFQYLEKASAEEGKKMGEMSLAEMDVYWERAKKIDN